jgi:hypothetical protein
MVVAVVVVLPAETILAEQVVMVQSELLAPVQLVNFQALA